MEAIRAISARVLMCNLSCNGSALTWTGISAVQQSVFGQGSKSGSGDTKSTEVDETKSDAHAAVDQAHPEQISEFMKDKYMSRTDQMNKEEGRP